MEMRIAAPPAPGCIAESELYEQLLALDGQRILELGCGQAVHTRAIANGGSGRVVTALEVDEIAHAANLALDDLPNVAFELGGAEAIAAADSTFDRVLMFKSLHHVPMPLMAQSLREIQRVLRPGGLAYFSEPIFSGAFNDIMRLFHDEREVRSAAFAALVEAVDAGLFELVDERFFLTESRYSDFAEYEAKLIGATHTEHRLSAAIHREVRERFARHMGPDGVRFEIPMRVDLLRRPL